MKVTAIQEIEGVLFFKEYEGESYDPTHLAKYDPNIPLEIERNSVKMEVLAREVRIGDILPDNPYPPKMLF